MRWRPLTWLLLSGMFFLGALYFWRLGDEWAAQRKAPVASKAAAPVPAPAPRAPAISQPAVAPLLTTLDSLTQARANAETKRKALLSHRLSNTSLTVGQLAHSEHAILLENALVDTRGEVKLNIPARLRAQGDPGAYIVQARGPLDESFRARLKAAGASIVAYIPNNAYLVRASQGVADGLRAAPETQSVLAYEPYYKLKPSLLGLAAMSQPLPKASELNLLLFSDAQDATLAALKRLGVEVLDQQRSPFGPVVRVRPPVESLPVLAGLSGVQELEFAHRRMPANDLSRARLGISGDTIAQTNYLGLSGTNVVVAVVDTGIDTNHPDLTGRILLDFAGSGTDVTGHGTHVAGIIAGSGAKSTTVTNAEGSIMPGTNVQFRGMAPAALLFSMTGGSDQYLQETAARQTNAFISNNSWTYGDNTYDLGAATYDAAVRDSLPGISGSQPLVYVFPAGNGGGMNNWDDGSGDDGQGGVPDSIESPGTAKNVITVGAIEQFRNITNQVVYAQGVDTNGNQILITNTQWKPSTDSSNQVAGFSGRGNVGISIEGDNGRFKPDVVAPGTAVISTRSGQWDTNAYYNPTSHLVRVISDAVVVTNGHFADEIFVPFNAVQVNIAVFRNVHSPDPFPDMPILVKQSSVPTNSPGGFDLAGTNRVSIPAPTLPLSPVGEFWFYSVLNQTNENVSLNIEVDILVTNYHGNFLQVLSDMNESIGPWYRYESGTSLAAAEASGTLALMEEFFGQRLGRTNASPALMKALLINGARSVAGRYDFEVGNTLNHQGWGLVQLPTSLPGALSNLNTSTSAPMLAFDQDSTNALTTGQSHTRIVSLSSDAQDQPLKITLVWTDPPGDPVASIKLVNDLDLVVTNLDTGDVYFGNDIVGQTDFNEVWDTVSPPNIDVVNNVENVFLQEPLATNYSITVIGKRVNVNAVTAHTNNVAQDYALVITSGDGTLTNALTITNNTVVMTSANVPLVTAITNMFANSPNVSGGVLLNQHVGANTPLLGLNELPVGNTTPIMGPVAGQLTLGMTNQWHFYTITNVSGFTNAAFLTFLPPTLSMPRMGVQANSQENATRDEADIDLYVSTDSNLTNLDAVAVAGAIKSLGRGGSETIVLSNAVQGVYYIAVKAEGQEAAEYALLGVFSLNPFSSSDQQGNQYLQGFPVPATIPDATVNFAGALVPGGTYVFGVSVFPIKVHRVIVTNTITHQLMGDLQGAVSHNRAYVVLNNHSPDGPVVGQTYVYDDSNEKNVTGLPVNWRLRHSDGPGSLQDYGGVLSVGQWMLTVVDGLPGHVGTNDNLVIFLEKQQDLTNGIVADIPAGACRDDFLDVPVEATNLTVSVGLISGTGPLSVMVCPQEGGACQTMTVVAGTNSITIDKSSDPPLNAGTYVVRTCNLGPDSVKVFIKATLLFDLNGVQPIRYRSTGPTPILDDAVSYSTINVTNDDKIVSLEVGLRVDHPRVSDVAFSLISPHGNRLMLCENRGGLSTNGMGVNLSSTNIVPVNANGGAEAQTNSIDTGRTSGTISISWDMYGVPDRMTVYYQNNLIFDSGYVSYNGSTNLTYGPGNSTVVTIVMNQGGNPNKNTAWQYTVTSTINDYLYFTFTESTNLTITPVKFAPPPFVPGQTGGLVFSNSFELATPGIYTNGTTFDGWTVNSNQVAVTNDPVNDFDGGNYLQLGVGDISRPLATQGGHNYVLSFYYRLDSGPYFDGSFENPPGRVGGVYNAGDTFGGWTVQSGDVNDVLAAGWQPADGTTSLDMNGNSGGPGVIYQDIPTVPGQSYRLSFAYAGNPAGGPNPKTMQVSWDGAVVDSVSFDTTGYSTTNMGWVYASVNVIGTGTNRLQFASTTGSQFGPTLDAISLTPLGRGQVTVGPAAPLLVTGATNWQQGTIGFTATAATSPLDVRGLASGLIMDNFTLFDNGGGPIYVQPEESLDKYKRENADGTWTLEMLDSRVGATNPTPTLVSWQLSFLFENPVPLPIGVLHDETVTGTVCPGQTKYYTIAVPSWVLFATNNLFNVTGDAVNLWFNQNGAPSTNTGAGDFELLTNISTTGTAVLSGLSTPPLFAGQTYYLAVQNAGTNCATFSFKVDFDVYPLTLNVPVNSTNGVAFPPRYFSYNVTSNETGVAFQLYGLNGDVNLVARKGLPPFPDLTTFDYGSFNVGTNSEEINVFTNSDPVFLSPGQWYLGVFNNDVTPVAYTILVTDFTNTVPNLITLFNGIPYANTNLATGDSTDYYRFVVDTNALRAQFEIYDTNGPVPTMTLVARKGLPLPTLTSFDFSSPPNDGLITVFDSSTPVPLTPGEWFLSAVNVSGSPAAYTIKASDWPTRGTGVTVTSITVGTNGICFTWDALTGVHYFVQGKINLLDPAWITIPPSLTAPDTTPTWCLPLPSPYHFFRIGQKLQ